MSKAQPAPAQHPPPAIYEAELGSGPSGLVLRSAELDFDQAVARRHAGLAVVVCGSDLAANRALAAAIEGAVGPRTTPQKPHTRRAPFPAPLSSGVAKAAWRLLL